MKETNRTEGGLDNAAYLYHSHHLLPDFSNLQLQAGLAGEYFRVLVLKLHCRLTCIQHEREASYSVSEFSHPAWKRGKLLCLSFCINSASSMKERQVVLLVSFCKLGVGDRGEFWNQAMRSELLNNAWEQYRKYQRVINQGTIWMHAFETGRDNSAPRQLH